MRLFTSLLLLAVAAVLPAAAETRLERGKRVVNEALTALGGEKFLAMEDRTEEGRASRYLKSASPVAGRLGPVEVTGIYSDWRDAGGIKVPFKTVIQQAGQPFGESTISSFTANTGLKADEVGKKP